MPTRVNTTDSGDALTHYCCRSATLTTGVSISFQAEVALVLFGILSEERVAFLSKDP